MYKSLDELPVFFNPKEVGKILGISKSKAYELSNQADFFPSMRIGKRIIINKDAFIRWVEENSIKEDKKITR